MKKGYGFQCPICEKLGFIEYGDPKIENNMRLIEVLPENWLSVFIKGNYKEILDEQIMVCSLNCLNNHFKEQGK